MRKETDTEQTPAELFLLRGVELRRLDAEVAELRRVLVFAGIAGRQ